MARNNAVVTGVLVTLSVGIVAGVYLLVRGDEAPAQPRPDPVGQQRVAAGMRPAAVDSARRVELEDQAEEQPAPRLPEIRPESGDIGAENERRRAATSPELAPPPPVELSEAQVAANAAYLALQEQVSRDVGKQLDAQQAALKKACWKDTGGAKGADFAVNASFDAEGKMLAMGISEVRGAGAAAVGVGACLRQQAIALSVEKPGQSVTVEQVLHLP